MSSGGKGPARRRAYTEVRSNANSLFLAGAVVALAAAATFLYFESFAVTAASTAIGAIFAGCWLRWVAPIENYWLEDHTLHRQTRRGSTLFDLAAVRDIRCTWVPYSNGYVELDFVSATASLPLTDVTLELRVAVGSTVSQCSPGRAFGDARAMKALGMRQR